MSVPAAWRLYLPETWALDRERRAKAGVPACVAFRTKWRIALEEIDRLLEDDLPPAAVVADAGYGDTTECRDAVTGRGFSYVVAVKPATSLWPPGERPLPPKPNSGRGQPTTRLRRDAERRPASAREVTERLLPEAWTRARWREGTKGTMVLRFGAARVHPAHGDERRDEPRPVEWLLVAWPEDEPEPIKYWLSTVPEDVELDELVSPAKIRWRIQRDFQEVQDELGLDHYEGCGCRGGHHYRVLCMAA